MSCAISSARTVASGTVHPLDASCSAPTSTGPAAATTYPMDWATEESPVTAVASGARSVMISSASAIDAPWPSPSSIAHSQLAESGASRTPR